MPSNLLNSAHSLCRFPTIVVFAVALLASACADDPLAPGPGSLDVADASPTDVGPDATDTDTQPDTEDAGDTLPGDGGDVDANDIDGRDIDGGDTQPDVEPSNCEGDPCGEHGVCEVGADGAVCICEAGWVADAAGGCVEAPNDWSPGVSGRASVASDAVQMPESAGTAAVRADGELRVPLDAAGALVDYEPPFVLVDDTGDGALLVVSGAEQVGTELVLTVSPAPMTMLFPNADLSLEVPLAPLAAGEKAESDWVDVDLAGYVLFDDTYNGADIRVTVARGHIRFAPDFRLDYASSWGSLRRLAFSLSGTVSAGFELRVEASEWEGVVGEWLDDWAPSYEIPLAQTGVTVLVSGVPVRLNPYLALEYGLEEASLAGCGTFSVGAGFSSTLEAGASWTSDRGWEPTESYDFAVDRYGPTFDVKQLQGEVTTFVRLRAGVDVYDVAGPYVTLGPWARFGFAYDTPWQIEVGVDGTLGVRASAFGWDIVDHERSVFHHGEVLATGAPPCDSVARDACPTPASYSLHIAECRTLFEDRPAQEACIADRSAAAARERADCYSAAGCYRYQTSSLTTVSSLRCQAGCFDTALRCIEAYGGDPDCDSCFLDFAGPCFDTRADCLYDCEAGGVCREF